MPPRESRARVAVVSLGGTIAAERDPNVARGVTATLAASDLVAGTPQIAEVAEVTTVALRQMPSGDLTFEDLAELATLVSSLYDEGIDGVVVTQGTDTLEETAFALDLLVPTSGALVVSGAMRNPTTPGPDGPANLLGAVRVAATAAARDLGALVVLGDEIHAARFVTKAHATRPHAFASPNAGPLGWLVEDRVRLVTRVKPLVGFTPRPGPAPAVALYRCSLGDDARLIGEIGRLGYDGLVVEGFGGGHVPGRFVAALSELATRVPVLIASRTGAGEVLHDTYGFAGGEIDLAARGLLRVASLDGLKARVALTLALWSDRDHAAQLITSLSEAVAGEC